MEDEFNLTMKMLTGTDPNFDTETKEEFLDWLQKRKEKSMAVNKITHDDVTNFIKLLVEIGDVFTIDKDEYFVRNKTNEKLIKLKEGEKEFPIKIYHNNRVPGDYFYADEINQLDWQNVSKQLVKLPTDCSYAVITPYNF